MFVEYYTQFFPFVYVKFIHTNINDDSFEYYKAEYLKILLRCKEEKQKIFLFYDLNVKEANGTIPLSYLPKQIEFNKKIFDLNEKYVKVVILLRGILKPGYKIIIFDEPLAGLDNYHRGVVIDLIKQISNRKTVLIITHEKEILSICDNILDIREIKTGVPMKK